jgi:ubiquinone/menaquinone biosynthesis C-methylase UbiE
MSTVSYINQPAIHETRGSIPLAGNSHIYTVSKLLWPKDVEKFLESQLVGFTLHICCGKSKLGDIRLDLYEPIVDIIGNMERLPFANESFDTVLIDPPYNSKFQIMHDMLSELCRVARKRVIYQNWHSPVDKLGNYRKNHKFILTGLYNWMPRTYFGRMNIVSIFDNKEYL